MDQIIALGRQRVEVAEEAANAIAGGDKEAMIAAGKEASVLAGQYFQTADSFGFEACGSGGTDGPTDRYHRNDRHHLLRASAARRYAGSPSPHGLRRSGIFSNPQPERERK